MREAVALRPLGALVEIVDEKIVVRKDPDARYVGLENLATGSPDIAGWSPALNSISTNGVFREGDTLFGKLRPNLRKCVIAPFGGYCSTDILILRAQEEVAPRFAGRLLQSDAVFRTAIQTAVGTKMPRTAWHALRNLPVYAPPLPEQRQIAAILDTIDDAIRKTEQIIAKLKQVKQGLLHDLLTRGIDDNGELRDPERHPEQFKDSVLGRIPRGWEVVPLVEVLSVQLGFAFSSNDYQPAGVMSFRVANIGRPDDDLGETMFLPSRFWDSFPKQRLHGGEFVIVMVGATTGKLGRVPRAVCPALQNQNMWNLVPSTRVAREFLWCLLPSAVARHMALAQGSARDFLTQKDFLRTPTVVPPYLEQEKLASIVTASEAHLKREIDSIRKYRALKQGLMEDLLTGRVRVTPLLESSTP